MITRLTRIAKFLDSSWRVSVHVDPKTKQTYRFLERDQIIKKYKGQEDVFGTFTSIAKLGVFPGSSYKTPIGVYCYPIDYILRSYEESGVFDVPYPPEDRQKYLQVFRVKDISRCLVFQDGQNKIIRELSSGFTQEEVEGHLEDIKKTVLRIHDDYTQHLSKLNLDSFDSAKDWYGNIIPYVTDLDYSIANYDLGSKLNNYFGIPQLYFIKDDYLYNLFLQSAAGERIQEIKESGHIPPPEPILKDIWNDLKSMVREDIQFPHEKYLKALFYMVRGRGANYKSFKEEVTTADQRVETDLAFTWNFTRHLSGFNPRTWTVLLRKLGFIGAIDYDTGTIHENEPTQAVFFDPPSIERLEIINNQVPQYTGDSEDKRNLSRWTRNFKDEEVLKNMKRDLRVLVRYSNSVIDELTHNENRYVERNLLTVNNSINSLYQAWGWINTHPGMIDLGRWEKARAEFKTALTEVKLECWKALQGLTQDTESKSTLDSLYRKISLLLKILG